MKAISILEDEHRVIERVLDCLERVTELGDETKRLDVDAARKIIDFLRNFADRCHHAKEEDQLFPMMEARGFGADSGPVAVMRTEHEQGRELIRRMESAADGFAGGEDAALAEWSHSARGYVLLLRAHIQKEDHCLFPMAEQALPAADQTELLARFERTERDDIGSDVSRRYRELADTLTAQFGVGTAS